MKLIDVAFEFINFRVNPSNLGISVWFRLVAVLQLSNQPWANFFFGPRATNRGNRHRSRQKSRESPPPLYGRFYLYAFSSCHVSSRDGLMSPEHEDAAGISRFPRIRWETTSPVTRRVFRFIRVFQYLFRLRIFSNGLISGLHKFSSEISFNENDRATHVENILSPRLQSFLSFQYIYKWNKIGKTNNKFITSRITFQSKTGLER